MRHSATSKSCCSREARVVSRLRNVSKPPFRAKHSLRCRDSRGVEADPNLSLNRPIFQTDTKYRALRQAELDIKAYCEGLDDEGERQKCVTTLRRLESEEAKAYKGMGELESAVDATETLERLESMARQLSTCGGTKIMVDALYHLQQKQDQYGPGGIAEQQKGPAPPAGTERPKGALLRLQEVFDLVDTDRNGAVDVGEFRAAMDVLGKHLDGYMVSEICDALDIHGRLTFDQFCDIVDAEEVRSPEAARLRAMIHQSSEDHYADWINSWS